MAGRSEPLTLEIATRLRAAVAPLARQLRGRSLDPYTPTQWSVIGAIYRFGPIALGELAARERLSAPSISKVVVGLEDAGLVERFPDPDDRRICRVGITPEGDEKIERTVAARNAWLASRIETLSSVERGALIEALPVLERLLDEEGRGDA